MKPLSTTLGASSLSPEQEFAGQSEKSSRQRGFEELDLLGESLLKKHLPDKRSPQFEKKKAEKLSLNVLQQQKQKDFTVVLPEESDSKLDKDYVEKPESPKKKSELKPDGELQTQQNPHTPATTENSKQQINVNGANKNGHSTAVDEVKLADLNVPISSIKPGSIPPLPLQESDDGISIVLHFGQEAPREHVTAIVVTVINKLSEAIANYELKAVVPKGCKIKIQNPTTTSLPAHNPFVPPSAITQVMLIANPAKLKVSLKYIVSYTIDDEPQTEMGQVAQLPI